MKIWRNDIIFILQISVKAAGGEGIGVTGIMLWDGPEDGIATYDYKEEADWTESVAQCCLLDIIPKVSHYICLWIVKWFVENIMSWAKYASGKH